LYPNIPLALTYKGREKTTSLVGAIRHGLGVYWRRALEEGIVIEVIKAPSYIKGEKA